MVNVNECGLSISCSEYFLKQTIPIFSINYQRSWSFFMNAGLNNFSIDQPAQVFKKGSMALLEIVNGSVYINSDTDLACSDYLVTEFQSPGKKNFSICFRILTTRYYYENSGTVPFKFETPGVFNLNASIYDLHSNITYLQKNFNVVGIFT